MVLSLNLCNLLPPFLTSLLLLLTFLSSSFQASKLLVTIIICIISKGCESFSEKLTNCWAALVPTQTKNYFSVAGSQRSLTLILVIGDLFCELWFYTVVIKFLSFLIFQTRAAVSAISSYHRAHHLLCDGDGRWILITARRLTAPCFKPKAGITGCTSPYNKIPGPSIPLYKSQTVINTASRIKPWLVTSYPFPF